MEKFKNIFVRGAISAGFIADKIAVHQNKSDIGAHSIFLGQVRGDVVEGAQVLAIEYSCYEEMACKLMHNIREGIFDNYELNCMHVYHSIGTVSVGEICLFVFTSSRHRKEAIGACNELVEKIKAELPIWGKEVLGKNMSRWKENR